MWIRFPKVTLKPTKIVLMNKLTGVFRIGAVNKGIEHAVEWGRLRSSPLYFLGGKCRWPRPYCPKDQRKSKKIDPEIGVGLSWKTIKNQKQLILMSFPIVIYILIFNYVPIWGWLMAFQNYRPALKFSKQQWVGLKQFKFLFQDDTFLTVLRNTLAMSMINLVLELCNSHYFSSFTE